MKRCPACRRQFTEDLRFCLEDGSTLIPYDEPEVETRFARVPVQPQQRSRTLAYAVTIALVLMGGLALAAAGVGGYFYYRAQADRAVNIPPNNSASPKPSSNSTSPEKTPYISGPARDANITNSTANSANSRKPTPTPANPANELPPNIDNPGDPYVVDPNQKPANRPLRPVPKQISGGVLNGKATSLPKPPYPPAARAVRASGAVSVQVLVDESGDVVSASAVSGHPLLRASAVQAARSARFAPTVLSGQAVKVSGIITYNFVP